MYRHSVETSSISVDESTNVVDSAHLPVFIRCAHPNIGNKDGSSEKSSKSGYKTAGNMDHLHTFSYPFEVDAEAVPERFQMEVPDSEQ